MTPEKAVNNEVIEEQMVNSIERLTISKNDVEPLPDNIDQPGDWKKKIKCNRGPLC